MKKLASERSLICMWCDYMLLWWQAAMDFVVEEDLKAHLTCWYIQKYVKENPQPQYFEHISQWPYVWLLQKKKRDCQGINSALQHASWSHVNIQHETFQVLLHTRLSGSSDEWSWRHLCAKHRVERSLMSVTVGPTFTRDRRWIGLSQQVKPWTNELPKAEACYLRQKLSGCIF